MNVSLKHPSQAYDARDKRLQIQKCLLPESNRRISLTDFFFLSFYFILIKLTSRNETN